VTVKIWAYDGIVLDADDRGELPLEDLKDFVARAEHLGAPVRLFEYGIRATRMNGDGGPHLDWRD
jgi:hypothetical protein